MHRPQNPRRRTASVGSAPLRVVIGAAITPMLTSADAQEIARLRKQLRERRCPF
jgi:hypothetical protein